jgi:hypothetical protein
MVPDRLGPLVRLSLERNSLTLRACSLFHCQRLSSIRRADKRHRHPLIFEPAQSHPHLNRDRS